MFACPLDWRYNDIIVVDYDYHLLLNLTCERSMRKRSAIALVIVEWLWHATLNLQFFYKENNIENLKFDTYLASFPLDEKKIYIKNDPNALSLFELLKEENKT